MKQRNKTNKSVGNQCGIFRYTFKNLSLNKRVAHSINSIKFLSCCIRWLDLENLSLRERERERVSERERVIEREGEKEKIWIPHI